MRKLLLTASALISILGTVPAHAETWHGLPMSTSEERSIQDQVFNSTAAMQRLLDLLADGRVLGQEGYLGNVSLDAPGSYTGDYLAVERHAGVCTVVMKSAGGLVRGTMSAPCDESHVAPAPAQVTNDRNATIDALLRNFQRARPSAETDALMRSLNAARPPR
jgi:hypothetical protein